MIRTIIVTGICLFFFSVQAKTNINIEEIKARYSKYNAVILNQEYNYLIDVVDDSLSVQQTNTKEMLILNSHSKSFTNDYIYFGGFSSIKNKEAFTMIPIGKKNEKIEVTQFNEAHNTSGSVFYDDSKTIQFSYPSLQKNARTFLSYTINYSNPRFIRKSFLQSFIPVIQSKIVIKVHRDIKIGYKLLNNQPGKIDFKQYSKGKYNYFVWESENMESYKYAAGGNYTISYYSPHVAMYIKESNINGYKQTYLGTVDDLYKFYEGFVSELNKEYSGELKQLVGNITEGLADEEKVKAIYYWVQNNIKYVAYEQGYMGFVPMPASEVFKKRYGDCKGMSSLIKGMLEIAGLEGHFTWVGTRSIPYEYEELPLLSVDNHMIATYQHGDSMIILDGTFKFLDYGINPPHIQGKEMLVGFGSDKYKVCKIPVSPSSYSVVIDSINTSISDGSVLGDGNRTHKGYNKVELAYAMDGVNAKDYKKRFSKLFNKGNNKFKVDDYKVFNLFERDKSAEVGYNFILSDYFRELGGDIYINLNLDKAYMDLTIDTTGYFAPLENDFYCTERFINRFQLPEGYEVSFVPEDGSFEHEDFRFFIKYRKEDNFIILEKEIIFEFLFLLEDKIPQWNKMIKELNKHYRSSLVLKKSTT